jgi:hypothetical protein
LISKPRLKQVRPSSPYRPLFDDLNRAVMDLAAFQPGAGFGLVQGPFGGAITRAGQDGMWAVTDGEIPGAVLGDGVRRKHGRGDAFEMTVELDGDDVWFVRAGPDDPTRLTIFNPAQDPVDGNTLVRVQKDFGLWIIVWAECLNS